MTPKSKSLRPYLAFLLLTALLHARTINASGPDQYDLYYRENSKNTTVNFLEPGEIQSHSLHSAADEDWYVFFEPYSSYGFSRTVKVEVDPISGANIDPAILVLKEDGTTVTQDLFSGLPGSFDSNPAGQGEIYTWPIHLYESRLFIRISQITPPASGNATSYTLSITGGPASTTKGLGNITTHRVGPAGGDVFGDEAGILGKPPKYTPKTAYARKQDDIYTKRHITIAPGSFAYEQDVTFGHTLDAYETIKREPATIAWLQNSVLRKDNYSLVMLQIGDRILSQNGIRTFTTPLTLTLQLSPTSTYIPYQDGTPIYLNDVPDGYSQSAARVMIWNPATSQWVVFDPAPAYLGGGEFSTPISSIADYISPYGGADQYSQVYFGLEPLAGDTEPEAAGTKNNWLLYR